MLYNIVLTKKSPCHRNFGKKIAYQKLKDLQRKFKILIQKTCN